MQTRTKIIIVAIITIILLGGIGILVHNVSKNVSAQVQKENESVNNNDIIDKYLEDTESSSKNETINEIEENIVEENIIEENIVDEKSTVNNVEEQTVGQEEEETQKEIQSNVNDEEENSITEKEAINLVKKEWGEDDTVYYTVANKDDENYYISVNDNSTTSALAWYAVNIKTGEVSEN